MHILLWRREALDGTIFYKIIKQSLTFVNFVIYISGKH